MVYEDLPQGRTEVASEPRQKDVPSVREANDEQIAAFIRDKYRVKGEGKT